MSDSYEDSVVALELSKFTNAGVADAVIAADWVLLVVAEVYGTIAACLQFLEGGAWKKIYHTARLSVATGQLTAQFCVCVCVCVCVYVRACMHRVERIGRWIN